MKKHYENLTDEQKKFVMDNAQKVIEAQHKNDALQHAPFESEAYIDALYQVASRKDPKARNWASIIARIRWITIRLRKRRNLTQEITDSTFPTVEGPEGETEALDALARVSDNAQDAEILRLVLIEGLSIRDVLKIYPMRKKWEIHELILRAKERLRGIYGES